MVDSTATSQPQNTEADRQLDATLAALNAVQPPERLEQRIHARLAQQAASPQPIPWTETVANAWSLRRAAMASATFAAGAITAAVVISLLHLPQPHRATPATGPTAVSMPASVAPQPAPLKEVAAHPGLTVQAPGGRNAAINMQGTVATLRSRKQNSDPQLAANKQQKKSSEAKLAGPDQPAAQTTQRQTAPALPAQ
jgi:hypothetical protein